MIRRAIGKTPTSVSQHYVPIRLARPLATIMQREKTKGLPIGEPPGLSPRVDVLSWPETLNQHWLVMDEIFNHAVSTHPAAAEKETQETSESRQFLRWSSDSQAAMRNLYLALSSNDVSDIIQSCSALEEMGALDRVQDADVAKLSQILSDYLNRVASGEERTRAERVAIFLASKGYMEPMHSSMAFYLAKNNADAIIGLWDRCSGVKVATRVSGKRVKDSRLLFVTAAAAIKEDYGLCFTAFRTSSASFAPWQITDFTERHLFHKTARIRQRFRDYLKDAALARDIEHFTPLAGSVMEMGKLADFTALKSLYESVKDGLERGALTTSIDPGHGSHVQKVDRRLWSLFIWGAVECRSVGLAENFMSDMIGYGISPNLDMWNLILHGHTKSSGVNRLKTVLKSMEDYGIMPDIRTLTIVMKSLFDKQLLDQAAELFRTIQSFTPTPEDPELEDKTRALLLAYNVTVNGLLRNRMTAAGEKLVQKMREEGPQPDIVTYNTLLNRFTQMQDQNRIRSTLKVMSGSGLKPDIYTFTILYVGASRSGNHEMKTSILQNMKELDVKPNNALLSAAIHSVLESGSSDAIDTALQLLSAMEMDRDRSVQPTVVTYNTVMHSIDDLVVKKVLDSAEGFHLVLSLNQRMLSRRLRPNRPIQHLLLRMHLRQRSEESLQAALAIFEQIKREENVNGDTWYILLHGLERRREYELAKRMIAVLRDSSWDLRGSLLMTVDRINQY